MKTKIKTNIKTYIIYKIYKSENYKKHTAVGMKNEFVSKTENNCRFFGNRIHEYYCRICRNFYGFESDD